MKHKIGIVGIMVEDLNAVESVNEALHEYGDYIIGRMGLPHRMRGVNVIAIVMDAPNDIISALTGKLGMLNGVSAKVTYSKKEYENR